MRATVDGETKNSPLLRIPHILDIIGGGSIRMPESVVESRSSRGGGQTKERNNIGRQNGVMSLGLRGRALYYNAAILATRLRETNLALAAASFLPQKGRVAHILLSLAEALRPFVPIDRDHPFRVINRATNVPGAALRSLPILRSLSRQSQRRRTCDRALRS
jgi:hypothetical protein